MIRSQVLGIGRVETSRDRGQKTLYRGDLALDRQNPPVRVPGVVQLVLLFREVARKNINIDPMAENIIKLHICSSEPNWKGRVLNIKKFLNSLH